MAKTYLEWNGKEIEVHYDYQPEEKQVMYCSDGSGYPGCAESLEIYKIIFKGRDVTNLISKKDMESIENAVRKQWDDYDPEPDEDDYRYYKYGVEC